MYNYAARMNKKNYGLRRSFFAEPRKHFAGLFTATDFERAAVLFAFPLKMAKGVNKLLKLRKIHHVGDKVRGHIGESIAVNIRGVEIPNPVKGVKPAAKIAAHESERAGLDADAHFTSHNITIFVIRFAIVLRARGVKQGGDSPFAGVTSVAGDYRGQNGSGHFFVLLCLTVVIIAPLTGLVNPFREKKF